MSAPAPAPADIVTELTQMLYREAALLDDGRLEDWLAILDPQISYVAPIRQDLAARADGAPRGAEVHELTFFNETIMTLSLRVGKLRTGLSQTENPPSRVVRLVSNVVVGPHDAPGEHPVRSAFLVYRQHRQRDIEMLAGHRHDIWRHSDASWKLLRREILFAANVLPVKSLPLIY